MNAPAWPASPYAFPGLFHREPYKPRGAASPTILLWAPLAAAGCFGVGWGARWLAGVIGTELEIGFGIFGALFLVLVPFLVGVSTIPILVKAQVRRFWLLGLLDVLWAGCVLLGAFWPELGTHARAALGSADVTGWVYLILFAMASVLEGLLIFTINGSSAFRVHYGGDGRLGRWAETREAFFQSGTADRILIALERGDPNLLLALRGSPPSSAHSWNRYTTMILSQDPVNPDGSPAYLFLKDIWLGGGPIYTKQVHVAMGWARLRHVPLTPDEVARLKALLPELGQVAIPPVVPVQPQPQFQPQPAAAQSTVAIPAPLAQNLLIPGERQHPLGTDPGTPPMQANPSGTFVSLLPKEERRRMRLRFHIPLLLIPGLLFGGLFLSFLFMTLTPLSDANRAEWAAAYASASPADKFFHYASITCLITALVGPIVGLFLMEWLRRRLLFGAVRSRPGRLFDPKKGKSMILKAEEARSYHLPKVLEDAVILLHAEPGWVFIEAADTRVRIAGPETGLQLMKVNTHTLCISSVIGGGRWGICSRIESGLAGLQSPRVRAIMLWERIHAGAMPQEAGPVAR